MTSAVLKHSFAPKIEFSRIHESWSNKNNKQFYENLSLELYNDYLRKSGLDEAQDVAVISDYLIKANSIIDIGAGYGRVLKASKDLGCSANFTLIEYCRNMTDFLVKSFPSDEIVNADILNYQANKKYDIALLMWTTISVFFMDEQQACIKKLKSLLNKGGCIMIDVLTGNHFDEAQPAINQFYSTKINDAWHVGYVPTIKQLLDYAAKTGLILEDIRCYTANSVQRSIVILKNP